MKLNSLLLSIVIALPVCAWTGPYVRKVQVVNPGQAGAAPAVSSEFQNEVSKLTATGLKLKEAVEGSLDGAAHHLAAIFQPEKPKAPNEAFELRILEGDGQSAKTIFRRADFFFSFS